MKNAKINNQTKWADVDNFEDAEKLVNSERHSTINPWELLRKEIFIALGVCKVGKKMVTYGDDDTKYCLTRVTKRFVTGQLIPAAWRCAITAALAECARTEIAEMFESGQNEPMVYRSIYILKDRLSSMNEDEDPHLIINRFKDIFFQDNFIFNERKFNTLRTANKAAKKEAVTVQELDPNEDEFDSIEPDACEISDLEQLLSA